MSGPDPNVRWKTRPDGQRVYYYGDCTYEGQKPGGEDYRAGWERVFLCGTCGRPKSGHPEACGDPSDVGSVG